MKDTLLTSALTSEEEAAHRKAEAQLGKAKTVALGIWLEEYLVGGVSLERMAREVKSALEKIGVSKPVRHMILGEMLDRATSIPEPKRGRGRKGHPVSLKITAAIIVDLIANAEQLPKTRSETRKKTSAFQRASEVIADCGFSVSPETLIDWHSDWRP